MSIAVVYSGGANATAAATATVANATLGITGGAVMPRKAAASSRTWQRSRMRTPMHRRPIFTATINWGDGTTSVGAISSNDSGGFDVLGGHTYHHAVVLTLTVTINGNGGGTTSTQITAAVGNATLTYITKFPSVTEGSNFSGTVGAFTDSNLAASATDFTASITWGDGTTSTGTVSEDGNNVFFVAGSHTYAHEGTRQVAVTITEPLVAGNCPVIPR